MTHAEPQMTNEEIAEVVAQAIDKAFDYYHKGDHPNAEALFRQILNVNPDHSGALQMLGLIESRKPGAGESLQHLFRALSLEPDSPDVHNNMGLVYAWSDAKDTGKAEYHFRRAIELNPDALHFRGNLAILYRGAGRYDEAEKCLTEALEKDPKSLHVNFNYATFLGERHRWAEAREYYDKVLALEPKFAAAHYNLSNLLLAHGEWRRGWEEYEWRWDTYPMFDKLRNRFGDKPAFDGTQDLKGKTVLLYAEQGIGDTIQFLRFCWLYKHAGATVVLEEHAELMPLLEQHPDIDRLVKIGDPLGHFDYHAPLLSSCRLFGLNDEKDFEVDVPYLRTNRKKLPADWSAKDDANWEPYGDDLRVGIVWGGNPIHRNDPIRSCKLAKFRALQLPGVRLFGLQKDVRARYWPGIGEVDLTEGTEGMGIVDLKDFILDYNCTAALIERMDLVVAVDTATAHLAAAMGKRVYLLTANHQDWRWLNGRKDSPWYPTMRIFRQPKPHDWDSVFNEVVDVMAEEFRERLVTRHA